MLGLRGTPGAEMQMIQMLGSVESVSLHLGPRVAAAQDEPATEAPPDQEERLPGLGLGLRLGLGLGLG